MNNIFSGASVKAKYASEIYELLMKREFVSFRDVLCIHSGYENDFFDKHSYSSIPDYGELKKAFPEVIRAINSVCPNSIIDNGKKGKGSAKKYVGDIDDPLAEERKAIVQKSLEDYVEFCKKSAGLLPPVWFSSFFENTQVLLDTTRNNNSGSSNIQSSLEQNITNIELLPFLYQAITNNKVLSFKYKKFGEDPFDIILHPQFLKEYNGRWFVFGESDRKPHHAYNIPLDRIIGKIQILEDIEYIPAKKGFYREYFDSIIGVTHERNAKVETVLIRTKTVYQHGLLLTKPLHHSQMETKQFGYYDGIQYGEISIKVEPNRELFGKILSYGQYLEVISPLSLRQEIGNIIKSLSAQYAEK